MKLAVLLKTMRPSFLVMGPVCVFLGFSALPVFDASNNLVLLILVLVAATLAHISVNMLNEYYDFKSGLDLATTRTPFSGGSGALPNHPEMAGTVRVIGMLSLVITVAIGIYLAWLRGMEIIPIGLVGVILVITYTQWLNRFPLLCLVAPGLGFGVLMVVGSYAILNDGKSELPWLLSMVPFFIINNLLLLNQYPDIDADASVGRNTFPIAYGLERSNLVYGLFMFTAYALIPVYIASGYLPVLSMIACLPVIFSLYALFGAVKHTAQVGAFPRYMAANVLASILTPLLLGVSLLYA